MDCVLYSGYIYILYYHYDDDRNIYYYHYDTDNDHSYYQYYHTIIITVTIINGGDLSLLP